METNYAIVCSACVCVRDWAKTLVGQNVRNATLSLVEEWL